MFCDSIVQNSAKYFRHCRHKANTSVVKWVKRVLATLVDRLNNRFIPTIWNNTVFKTILVQFMQGVQKLGIFENLVRNIVYARRLAVFAMLDRPTYFLQVYALWCHLTV